MPEDTAARRELEQEWDRKLQQARERYFKAAGELHREVFENNGPVNADSPVLAAVRRREAAAFAEYCRVLATYTELTVNGKLPESPSHVAEMPRNPE